MVSSAGLGLAICRLQIKSISHHLDPHGPSCLHARWACCAGGQVSAWGSPGPAPKPVEAAGEAGVHAVEQDDQAQRISCAVPPLPVRHYTEHFDIYDACGLSASLSASNEDDRRLCLLSKMNLVVNVEEVKRLCKVIACIKFQYRALLMRRCRKAVYAKFRP